MITAQAHVRVNHGRLATVEKRRHAPVTPIGLGRGPGRLGDIGRAIAAIGLSAIPRNPRTGQTQVPSAGQQRGQDAA
jgi:hypothetical protein